MLFTNRTKPGTVLIHTSLSGESLYLYYYLPPHFKKATDASEFICIQIVHKVGIRGMKVQNILKLWWKRRLWVRSVDRQWYLGRYIPFYCNRMHRCGLIKTKKGMNWPRRHWRSTLYYVECTLVARKLISDSEALND